MNKAFRLSIFIILFVGCEVAIAQNPLRAHDDNQLSRPTIEHMQRLDTRQNGEALNENRYHSSPAFSTATANDTPAIPVRLDMNVAPASFDQIPMPNVGSELDNPNSLTSTAEGSIDSHDQFLNLVMKISLNLVFVLSFAVGVILIFKRWMQNGNSKDSSWRATGDSLCVRETLRVDNQTTIRLVQWRSNRFLIACDKNGIQSVNALNAAFEQTLEELDSEPADKKTLERLLAGMSME